MNKNEYVVQVIWYFDVYVIQIISTFLGTERRVLYTGLIHYEVEWISADFDVDISLDFSLDLVSRVEVGSIQVFHFWVCPECGREHVRKLLEGDTVMKLISE